MIRFLFGFEVLRRREEQTIPKIKAGRTQTEGDGYVTRGGASGPPETRTGRVSPPRAAFLLVTPSALRRSPSSRTGAEHGLHPTVPAVPGARPASSCPRWEPARLWAVCLLFASEELKLGN